MTKEERAEQSRVNGAKSKGPTSPEGIAQRPGAASNHQRTPPAPEPQPRPSCANSTGDKSSMNALKTGQYSEKFPGFLPPHWAAACNEDRDIFHQFHQELIETYKPKHALAHSIVRDIATARQQIERFNVCVTMAWNFALIESGRAPLTIDPELSDVERNVRATNALLAGPAVLARLNREIGRLQKQIQSLEKHLVFVHKNFPADPPKPQPVPMAPKIGNEPNIVTSEADPVVIANYRRQFPNRTIVIVPASQGNEIDGNERKDAA